MFTFLVMRNCFVMVLKLAERLVHKDKFNAISCTSEKKQGLEKSIIFYLCISNTSVDKNMECQEKITDVHMES